MTDIARNMVLENDGPYVRLHTYDNWAALALSVTGLNLSIHLTAQEVRKLAQFFAESAAELESQKEAA